jgi:hypothetical protein
LPVVRRLLPLLAVVLALVLSACRVEVRAEVAVRDDGTGEVAVTVVADAEAVRAAPSLADDFSAADATAAGWTVDGPTLTPEGGLVVVARKPFRTIAEAEVVLAEISGPGGPLQSLGLTQERAFAEVETSFTGEGRLDGGLAAFGDSALVAALGGRQPFEVALGDRPLDEVLGITLTVLLPGEVTEAAPAGELAADGSAASYRVPVDGTSIDLGTTAVQRDEAALAARRREQLALVALLAWLALVLVGGTLWLWRRRRAPAPEPDPHGAAPPSPPSERVGTP